MRFEEIIKDNDTDIEAYANLANIEEKLNNKVDIVSERTIRTEIKPYIYKDLIIVWREILNYI